MLLQAMDVRTTTVVAATDIPENFSVKAYQGAMDLGAYLEDQPLIENVIKVWFQNEELISEADLDWRLFVHAARDRHEQNLELYRQPDYTTCLRTIRHISKGEQLLAWYETALAMELNIPFISFQNIRDVGSYMCQQCGFESEYPNPLKAHLKFHCNVLGTGVTLVHDRKCLEGATNITSPGQKKILYPEDKQQQSYSNARYDKREFPYNNCSEIPRIFIPKFCDPQTSIVKPHTQEFNSVKCEVTYGLSKFCYPCSVKATVLVKSRLTQDNTCPSNKITYHQGASPVCCTPSSSLNCSSHDMRQLPCLSLSNSMNNERHQSPCMSLSNGTDDEQIDVLHRSFLALSSRRGHLCLYCGKFYSRKYGLKIHLRTHTGYKPLKCKICSRPFGDPSNLNKHVRLHAEGDTPYKCKHCGKVLVRKRDLTRHIKSRHQDSC